MLEIRQIDVEQAKEARRALKQTFSLYNESKLLLACMLLNELPEISPAAALQIYEQFVNNGKKDEK